MSKKQDDSGEEEESTPPAPSIANIANRQLLAVVGKMVLETHEHRRALRELYTELRDHKDPAPPSWAPRLLEEEERHHRKAGENIEELRTLVTREA